VNNTVKFECLASSNIPLVNISLWHNNTGTWARNATVTTTATSAIAHYTVTGLSTSNFIWNCIACTAEGCTASAANRTLLVDITKPVIEFHSSSVGNATKRATNYNNAYVNTTITEASNNMSAFIDWNRSLVGWWRLENDGGTTFQDSSTWDNDATCTGATCPNLTTGMRGKAYYFDGTSDTLSVNLYNGPNIASEGTFVAWVNPANIPADSLTHGIGDITFSSGKLSFFKYFNNVLYIYDTRDDDNAQCSSAGLTKDAWHQYTAVWKQGEMLKLYLDGNLLCSSGIAYNGTGRTTSSITIGYGYNEEWNGSIDETIVFSRALSPEEINASYSAGVWKLYHNFTSLSSGTYTYKAYVVDQAGNLNNTEQRTFIVNSPPTQGYPTVNTTYGTNKTTENITAFNWSTADVNGDAVTNIWNWYNGTTLTLLNLPFEGGSTDGTQSGYGSTNDYSGYSNTVQAMNISWNRTGGIDGTGAYNFITGNYSFLTALVSASNYGNVVTVTAWMRQDNNDAYAILAHGGTIGPQWLCGRNGGNFIAAVYNGTFPAATATSNPSIGDWHHYACVIGGAGEANTSLYIDGKLNATTHISGPFTIQTRIAIGGLNSTYSLTHHFNGSIDNFQMWKRELSAEQISALYAKEYNRIVQQETFSGETWSACLTPNDGYDDGATMCTRANITINTPPTKVVLDTPAHGNITMTNRSINFKWLAATDADEDSLTYNLSIKCYATAGGSCPAPGDNRDYGGINGTSYNLTEANELRYVDNEYYYNWSVQAYDGFEYGEISNQSNFTIMSEVILNMINDSINWGNKAPGYIHNTTDNIPPPMVIQNDGNVVTTVNITSATYLFDTKQFPSSNYKLKINNTAGYLNTFNNIYSQTNWTNIPILDKYLINMLNYSTNSDKASIHVHIEIPNDEPAGNKSSILTITGWSAAV
jgi:hypothetical protein